MLIDSLISGQEGAFKSALMHLILPTIVLGTIPLAIIVRQTRSAMLEVLRQDYIKTAKAKGLSQLKVIFKHALRNALLPFVTGLSGIFLLILLMTFAFYNDIARLLE